MSKRVLTVREAGYIGGINRAKKLSKERRLEIAIQGSKAAQEKYNLLSPEEKKERARKANLASQEARRKKKLQ